jgi:hypothetical protein
VEGDTFDKPGQAVGRRMLAVGHGRIMAQAAR